MNPALTRQMNQRVRRQVRKALAAKKDQKWFGEPMTGRQAGKIARAESGAEYNPTIRQIKGDIRASVGREKQIGGWFGQLGSTIDQQQQQSTAAASAADAALGQQLQRAAEASQSSQAQIAGQNADFSKLTGADPAAFAKTTQSAAAGADQRAMTQAALSAPLIQAGATQQAYLGNLGVNAQREGIYQRGQEFNRRQQIKQDLSAAKKQRGQATVKNLNELRQGERDSRVQEAAFGFDKQKFGAEQQLARQEAARDASENAQKRALESAKYGETVRHNRATEWNSRHGGSKANRAYREGMRNAEATARTLYEKRKWPSWAALTQRVAKESEVSPSDARVAVRKLREHVEGKEQDEKPWYAR